MSWRINSMPEALARQYAYRESLFRLGFEDDQVLLGFGRNMLDCPAPPGEVSVTVELFVDPKANKSEVMPDFIITCGSIATTLAVAETASGSGSYNALSQEERTQLYEQWHPWPMMFHLAHAMVKNGIDVPHIDDVRHVAALRGLPTLVPVRQEHGEGGN